MQIETILRGGRFRPLTAQQTTLALAAHEPLQLNPEPTNKYDPDAIQVLARVTDNDGGEDYDEFIGYVAKEHCAAVYALGDPASLFAYCLTPNGLQPTILITDVEVKSWTAASA